MKYICAYFIGGIHTNPAYCKSKAPFNPILGETYQAVHPDGTKLYMEQTVHHPPTFNFLINGPDNKYTMMGFGTIVAHLDGLNTIKGWRDGKVMLVLNDGTKITATNLQTRIKGVIMGDRTYNYYGNLILKDFKNKIECTVTVEDEVNEGVIAKLFSKKKNIQYDEFKVEIKQVNPETKHKEVKATGVGSWLGQLYFGDKCYWDYFAIDKSECWKQDDLWLLPSDSTKREDLIAVLKGDIDTAQKEKERLEDVQRQDQKKRDEYKKK